MRRPALFTHAAGFRRSTVECLLMVAAMAIQPADRVLANDDAAQSLAVPPDRNKVIERGNNARAVARRGFLIDRQNQLDIEKWNLSEKLNSQLKSTIADIDRICQLTGPQKQKLEMIGERDQANLVNRIIDARRGQIVHLEIGFDQKPLPDRAGLCSNSFFTKSLPSTLSENQIRKLREFRRVQLSDCTAATIKDLRKFVVVLISDEQAVRLIDLLIEFNLYTFPFDAEEIPPSLTERYLILYQLSAQADEKVKPLFAAEQWQKLEPRLHKFRSFESQLKQRGLITANDDHSESDRDDSK